MPLAGNSNLAFDQVEIFKRKKKGITQSNTYSINKVKTLDKEMKSTININLTNLKSWEYLT